MSTSAELLFFIFLMNKFPVAECTNILQLSVLPKFVLLDLIQTMLGAQEELILGIVNNPHCKPRDYKHSYLQSFLVLLLCTVLVRHFSTLLIVPLSFHFFFHDVHGCVLFINKPHLKCCPKLCVYIQSL